ncbi:MAG: hypothetical protein EAZ55_10705 [Cytophagales bacterium]|nr:MAG: hypothetical protein EAZ55_10705 [Cytophagales bacterium]
MQKKSFSIPESIIDLIYLVAEKKLGKITKEKLIEELMDSSLDLVGSAKKIIFIDDQKPEHTKLLRELIDSNLLETMIVFTPKGFETLQLPGSRLCFLDYNKPQQSNKENFLLLNAYYIYHPINISLRELTKEQVEVLSHIVYLYRKENYKFLYLIDDFISSLKKMMAFNVVQQQQFIKIISQATDAIDYFYQQIKTRAEQSDKIKIFELNYKSLTEEIEFFINNLLEDVENTTAAFDNGFKQYKKYIKPLQLEWSAGAQDIWEKLDDEAFSQINTLQNDIKLVIQNSYDHLQSLYHKSKGIARECRKLMSFIEIDLLDGSVEWEIDEADAILEKLYEEKEEQRMQLDRIFYYYQQMAWLQNRFPQAEFKNLKGLCKIISKEEFLYKFQLENTLFEGID